MKKIQTLFLALFLTLGVGAAFASELLDSRVQVIHNSPDPAYANVKVWASYDGTTFFALPGLDNVAFRQATPFFPLSSDIVVLPATITLRFTAANQALPTPFAVESEVTISENGDYHLVANGVGDPLEFADVPDIATFYVTMVPRQPVGVIGGPATPVFVAVHHGAPGAPGVDIVDGTASFTFAQGLSFGQFTDYGNVLIPDTFIIRLRLPNTTTNVASFVADLSSLQTDDYVLVIASGFLDSDNGAALGLIAVLENGTVLNLPKVPTLDSRVQVIHNAADSALTPVTITYRKANTNDAFESIGLSNVPFRGASAFIDLANEAIELPATLEFRFALSGDVEPVDVQVPLAANGSYYLVATGVANPGAFTPNPNDRNIGFTVLAHPAPTAVPSNQVHLVVLHGATDAPRGRHFCRCHLQQLGDQRPLPRFQQPHSPGSCCLYHPCAWQW